MMRLDKVTKAWKESAALNDHTKQEYAVKRLDAALKAFGLGFHVYQYLFKSNRPDIPFARYDDPIVETAINQRRQFFEAKRDNLYQVEIFYAIVLEGQRSKSGVGAAFAQLFRDPAGAIGELRTQFTNNSMRVLLRSQIERELTTLEQKVQAFTRQLADFMQIEVLTQQGQFRFFRRLLNYDEWRIVGKPQSTQFLDYQVVNSNIEAERDHLRVGDHFVRVLTMKEAITETRPLVLDALLKIPANFYVATEWTPLATDKARREVNKRRRHFNMSKTGFVSQMGNDATKTNPRDVLVDESKQADIENLGDCLRALGDGQSLGGFSLTVVAYAPTKSETDRLIGEFTSVFTNADGNLFTETYNQLNAYFATVPGNYALNLRKVYLLNTNYADTRQHQGVEAGRPFEQLQEAGMRTAKLDQIVRQKDPELKTAVEMLAIGQVSTALEALQRQGRVREIFNTEERIRVIARSYIESPERTLIVSPDNASRRELNAAVRQELKANGTVAPEDHSFRVFVQRQDMTGAERSWAGRYEISDVIRYVRGSKNVGINAGEYGTVVGINSAFNLLTVEKSTGELVNYDPRRLVGVNVYRAVAHEFSAGDRIQFTAPSKSLGVANRDLAVIESIAPDGRISARLDNNRKIDFNPVEHRHFDHGYAVTSHSAQGLTAERVLVNADTGVHPDLLNSRFGYVAVSRASHELTLFTNDITRLRPQLSVDLSKTSALEFDQHSPAVHTSGMGS
jgi:AAA domain-containing protein/UvrD-like helicase family protein/type IV secretion system CagE/TrbE/VirB family protein